MTSKHTLFHPTADMSVAALDPLSNKRVAGLDGVRAVCVILVLMHHGWPSLPGAATAPKWFAEVFGNGHLGVAAFFTLSGYLITGLLLREQDQVGGIRYSRFLVRRFVRLMPPYLVYLATLGLLTLAGQVNIGGWEWTAAFLYIWNYKAVIGLESAGSQGWWYLGHTWSLAVEQQFYLLWPLLLYSFHSRKAGYFAFGLLLLGPAIRVGHYLCWPTARGSLGMMLHTSFDYILVGCLLALHWNDLIGVRLRRLCEFRVAPIVSGVFVFLVSPILSSSFGGWYSLPIGITLEAGAIGILLVWVLSQPRGLVGKLLRSHPLTHLGLISYSVYIWQPLLLPPSPAESLLLRFPFNFICCLLVGELSYRVIEMPLGRLREKLKQPMVSKL